MMICSRNCCWNSLTTVTRLKTGHIFDSTPTALPLCYEIMHEVEAVAKAKGLVIPDGTVEGLIKRARAVEGPGMPSSMMADCLAGRPTEVEVGGVFSKTILSFRVAVVDSAFL